MEEGTFQSAGEVSRGSTILPSEVKDEKRLSVFEKLMHEAAVI